MKEVFRLAVIATTATLLILSPAGAQVIDPDPAQPGAQQIAEIRAVSAMLGFMPPPIGWLCTVEPEVLQGVWITGAHCEPDLALLEQQECAHQEWLDEFRRRAERIRSGLGRRR